VNVLLEEKNAIVYGGGGAVGGAVARAFAGQGAQVFLAGRTRDALEAVAEVADVAAFVASDRAAVFTGTVVNLAGGMTTG
jgi:3-oxoacyl-[acyl-carrier protein] reductase